MEVSKESFEAMQAQLRKLSGGFGKNKPLNTNIRAFQANEGELSRRSIAEAHGFDPDSGQMPVFDREWPKAVHRQGEILVANRTEQKAAEKLGYRLTPTYDEKGNLVAQKEWPRDMNRPREMKVANAKELEKAKKAGWLETPFVAEEAEQIA